MIARKIDNKAIDLKFLNLIYHQCKKEVALHPLPYCKNIGMGENVLDVYLSGKYQRS